MSSVPLIVAGATALLLLSCRGAENPDKVANQFVDAYFLEFDFDGASKLTEGAATERLERDRKLADPVRDAVQLESSRSRVYYGKPERREAGADQVHYTYALEVHAGDVKLDRRVVVLVARRGGRWKVISFREVGAIEDGASRPGEADPGAPSRSGVRTGTAAEAADR